MDTKKAVLLIAIGIGSMALMELGEPGQDTGEASRASVMNNAEAMATAPSDSAVAFPGDRVAQTEDILTPQ